MDTLSKLLEKHKHIQDELFRLKRLHARKDWLIAKVQLAQKKEIELESVATQEYIDIADLEKLSLPKFFRRSLVNAEEQMKREKQEYLIAVMRWNAVKNTIQEWNFEIEVIELQIKKLQKLHETKNENIKNIQKNLSHISPQLRMEISITNHEAQKLADELQEIEEAEAKLNEIANQFDELKQRLASTVNWGQYDVSIGPGKISYKRLTWKKNIFQLIASIDRLHIECKKELQDLKQQIPIESFIQWDRIKKFVEPLSNEMITLWIHKRQLKESLLTIEKRLEKYTMIRQEIEMYKKKIKLKFQQNRTVLNQAILKAAYKSKLS